MGSIKVDETHVQLPKIGRVRISPGERDYVPDGTYRSVSLVQEHGEWFASVHIEVSEEEPVVKSILPEVGIDLGVRKLAVLATPDGEIEIFHNRRSLLRAKRKLRAAQKKVSRRTRGSGRRRRAVRTLGRIHRQIKNVRKDMTHKTTTDIAERFKVVALEDLKLKNMTRRAHGPGRAAKGSLNCSLLDANLGEFRRQLEYKLKRVGGWLVLVDPAYTSQHCSCCGMFNDCGSNEIFTCVACGVIVDRDENAARNILSLARGEIDAASWSESKNARGEVVRRPSLRVMAHASAKREQGREERGQN